MFSRENPLVDSILLTATSSDTGADSKNENSFSNKFIESLQSINNNVISPIFLRERKDSNDKTMEEVKANIARSKTEIDTPDLVEE